MTDFYSQNRCVCSTRSHGPLLCAFCLSFHFNIDHFLFARTTLTVFVTLTVLTISADTCIIILSVSFSILL